MKDKKVSLYTLGCRTNQSETAVIRKDLETSGYKIVDISEPAEISVINTCTVTEKGDTDCRKIVNKLCRINPDVKIALIGCQAQIQKEQLLKLPNVKWVIGTAEKMDVVSLIERPGSEPDAAPSNLVVSKIPRDPFKLGTQSINTAQTRANLKIQDGCDYFCSYCEVPYARGRARSRYFNDIIKEAKNLSKAGYKEIVITGINVGTYNDAGKKVLDVIKALQQIDSIERIRISSIEFRTITRALMKLMSQKTKLCRYLHVPLQNADDTILKSMNRKYSFAEFKDFIEYAHEQIPDICIGSDIIVGFPNETAVIFQSSVRKIRSLPLAYLHVFSYSKRNMAVSKDFPYQIPKDEISKRSKILRDLSCDKRHTFLNSMIGTTQQVLFEQKKGESWNGLTDNYIRVKVKHAADLSNRLANVNLNRIEGQTIIGTISRSPF